MDFHPTSFHKDISSGLLVKTKWNKTRRCKTMETAILCKTKVQTWTCGATVKNSNSYICASRSHGPDRAGNVPLWSGPKQCQDYVHTHNSWKFVGNYYFFVFLVCTFFFLTSFPPFLTAFELNLFHQMD